MHGAYRLIAAAAFGRWGMRRVQGVDLLFLFKITLFYGLVGYRETDSGLFPFPA